MSGYNLYLVLIISYMACYAGFITGNETRDSTLDGRHEAVYEEHHDVTDIIGVTAETTGAWTLANLVTRNLSEPTPILIDLPSAVTTELNLDVFSQIMTESPVGAFGLANRSVDWTTISELLIDQNYTDLGTTGTDTMHLPSPSLINYFPILILTISGGGLLGNSIALILLNRKAIKQIPCRLFLLVLTCSDSVFLLLTILRLLIFNLYYTWICQAVNFLYFLTLYYSKFIIMGIGLERFLVICFPIKSKSILHKNSELIYCIISFFTIAAGFSYETQISKLVPFQTDNGLTYQCMLNDQGVYYLDNVAPWLELFFSLIPTAVIIVCTISMIVGLVRSSRLMEKNNSKTGGKNNMWAASAVLLTVCIAFTVLDLPMIIYYMINPTTMYNMDIFHEVFGLMELFNHAGNCVFYIAGGSIFRKEIKVLCLEVYAKLCRRNGNNIEV